jgi:hypothetical protein
MVTRSVYTEVEVDVDLSDFDTEDLVDELKSRGYDYNTEGVDGDDMRELLEAIWYKRRLNKDYQPELEKLIWEVLGKIV